MFKDEYCKQCRLELIIIIYLPKKESIHLINVGFRINALQY